MRRAQIPLHRYSIMSNYLVSSFATDKHAETKLGIMHFGLVRFYEPDVKKLFICFNNSGKETLMPRLNSKIPHINDSFHLIRIFK